MDLEYPKMAFLQKSALPKSALQTDGGSSTLSSNR